MFEAGESVEFDFPIRKTLIYDNKIIVLLDVFRDTGYNQNIFAVNFKGQLLWQVEKSIDVDVKGFCPFTSVEVNQLELICLNKCGFRFTVNPSTGEVTSQVYNK
jgi:hypothetical protein